MTSKGTWYLESPYITPCMLIIEKKFKFFFIALFVLLSIDLEGEVRSQMWPDILNFLDDTFPMLAIHTTVVKI